MKVPLWIVRKVVYTVTGAALGGLLSYVTGHPDLNSWTIAGATSALGAAVIGDLRREYLPNFLTPKAPTNPQ